MIASWTIAASVSSQQRKLAMTPASPSTPRVGLQQREMRACEPTNIAVACLLPR